MKPRGRPLVQAAKRESAPTFGGVCSGKPVGTPPPPGHILFPAVPVVRCQDNRYVPQWSRPDRRSRRSGFSGGHDRYTPAGPGQDHCRVDGHHLPTQWIHRPPVQFIDESAAMGSQTKMNILLLTDEWDRPPIGGTGRYLRALADGASSCGHTVTVLIIDDRASASCADPRTQWIQPDHNPSVKERARDTGHAVRNWYLRQERQSKFDLVIAPVWNTPALGLTDIPGVPLISTVTTPLSVAASFHSHGLEHRDVQVQIRHELHVLRASRVVHFLSETVRRTVDHRIDLGTREVVVSPVPSGLAPSEPPDLSFNPPGRRRLLYVGRLEARKGLDVLVEAVGEVLSDREVPPFSLLVAGDTSPIGDDGRTMLERFTECHGASTWWNLLDFLGYLDDDALAAIYQQVDAVCVPSRYESQALVGNEALQFGRPLIGSDTGALSSMISGNGWLTVPGDLHSMQTALRNFANASDLERRGRRSLELARPFNSSELSAHLMAQFARCVRKEGRSHAH